MAKGKPLFVASSLARLGDALTGLEWGGPNCTVDALSAMYGRLNPASWNNLIAALVERRLPAVARLKEGTRILGSILIDPVRLNEILGIGVEPSMPEEAVLSCAEAGRVMGLSNTFFGAAVSQGIVRAKRLDVNRIEIPLSELVRFGERFLSGPEGCRLLGVSGRQFSGLMRAEGHTPLAIIFKTRLWDRQAALLLIGVASSGTAPRKSRAEWN